MTHGVSVFYVFLILKLVDVTNYENSINFVVEFIKFVNSINAGAYLFCLPRLFLYGERNQLCDKLKSILQFHKQCRRWKQRRNDYYFNDLLKIATHKWIRTALYSAQHMVSILTIFPWNSNRCCFHSIRICTMTMKRIQFTVCTEFLKSKSK